MQSGLRPHASMPRRVMRIGVRSSVNMFPGRCSPVCAYTVVALPRARFGSVQRPRALYGQLSADNLVGVDEATLTTGKHFFAPQWPFRRFVPLLGWYKAPTANCTCAVWVPGSRSSHNAQIVRLPSHAHPLPCRGSQQTAAGSPKMPEALPPLSDVFHTATDWPILTLAHSLPDSRFSHARFRRLCTGAALSKPGCILIRRRLL